MGKKLGGQLSRQRFLNKSTKAAAAPAPKKASPKAYIWYCPFDAEPLEVLVMDEEEVKHFGLGKPRHLRPFDARRRHDGKFDIYRRGVPWGTVDNWEVAWCEFLYHNYRVVTVAEEVARHASR